MTDELNPYPGNLNKHKVEPLLSDEKILDQELIIPLGAKTVRDFYEGLITTGKLRVVEEVEMKGNVYDCLLQCTSCNWGIGWHIEEDLEPMKYCPGCGNPIKRP